jgi:ParB/RepB/Spo0J family partition protein
MATATATPKKKATTAPASDIQIEAVDLKKIESNSAQSRGMGALPALLAQGYGLFEKVEAEKETIWSGLLSDNAEVREQARKLIDEYEGKAPDDEAEKSRNQESFTTKDLAASIRERGQLHPVGLMQLPDGNYDVVYGMGRCIARAYNATLDPVKYPPTVDAKIYPFTKDELKLKLMSKDENKHRRESPMDKAIFYKELQTEHKLEPKEIADLLTPKRSTQHVKDHLLLVTAKELASYAMQLHDGTKSVDWAIKYVKRERNGASESSTDDGRKRGRLPNVKSLKEAYDCGIKPKSLPDDAWDLFKLDDVRKFFSIALGWKFKAFIAPKEKPATKAQDSNGEAANKGTIKVARALADRLLLCLGMTNASTWADAEVLKKLNKIGDYAQEGVTIESKPAQKLLDYLLANSKAKVVLKDK